ncbi:MAG: VCBS repeat-containing protein [Candidatus Omnitrophica bacterium]|nr:hypothetical protein [bacterium]NUN97485.1 VCBS repeat-containing protein [Candidatus Omnitrophota bacterium]
MGKALRQTLFGLALFSASAGDGFPVFKIHDINPEAGTGLAIAVADIDGDGKPDIIGVSADDVAWYENPNWERHLIAGTLKGSNVCVAAQDLDGDGLPELALGADWQFNNTKSGGSIHILHRGQDPRQPWNVRDLLAWPSIHRIRWADFNADGKPELIVAPLKGKDSTPPYHIDKATRLFALHSPDKPFEEPWREETLNESLHVVHNLWASVGQKNRVTLLAASLEGITALVRTPAGEIQSELLARGHPEAFPNSGAGEIKVGEYNKETPLLGSIEPWHAHQAVVYTPLQGDGGPPASLHWERHVVDDRLAGGHAIYWADFDGDGADELLVGFRDKAGPKELPGLNVYDLDFDPARSPTLTWTKRVIDDGGMATEDAVAEDLNGDGRPDIVAFGRATHNIRYYENLGEPAQP